MTDMYVAGRIRLLEEELTRTNALLARMVLAVEKIAENTEPVKVVAAWAPPFSADRGGK